MYGFCLKHNSSLICPVKVVIWIGPYKSSTKNKGIEQRDPISVLVRRNVFVILI